MLITFSRNHNGDALVLVDGEVKAVAKSCDGYDYLRDHIIAFDNPLRAENAALLRIAEAAEEWSKGTVFGNDILESALRARRDE